MVIIQPLMSRSYGYSQAQESKSFAVVKKHF
jgi:hypothetical protein